MYLRGPDCIDQLLYMHCFIKSTTDFGAGFDHDVANLTDTQPLAVERWILERCSLEVCWGTLGVSWAYPGRVVLTKVLMLISRLPSLQVVSN